MASDTSPQIKCLFDKLVKIKDLQSHPKNRNKHPEDQISRLASILKYQGFRYPIKVSKLSGYVTSGHGRIEAAKLNGWKEVPVNFQDYDSEEQEYADVQADNAIASWAELDLSGINSDIGELGPDFDINLLGIKDFVVEPADKLDPQCDEDEVHEYVEPKTKLGDIYRLGNHRLMCGDSTSIDDVEGLINKTEIDMCFTSPPYNAGKKGYEGGKSKYLNNDDCSGSEWIELMNAFTALSIEFCKYSFINVQWIYSNKIKFIEWLHTFKEQLVQDIIWCKPNMPNINAQCLNLNHEYVFVFNKENKNRKIKLEKEFRGSISSYFEASRAANKEFSHIHRATFNVSLPEKFINDFGPKTVIDFFGGTGSTLIACEKTNRKCFMMELDPHYCDVIVARWEKYTGKKAELLVT